ncbi:MAG: universal stress protein [Solirubrobacteraceae bacterium]|nr:universal stress protein [Solirubrobacteraceae bacterium]
MLDGFQRIVVAVGSGVEQPAIDLALALGAPDAVIVLARVHAPEPDGSLSAHQNADLAGLAEALSVLRTAKAAVGRPCELVAEAAAPVVGLHRIAEDERADLLVIGPHRELSGVHAVLPAVLHGAPCAVAIVGHGASPAPRTLGRVAFAYAPTAASREGAAVASALAAQHGAELHGVHVVPAVASLWAGRVGGTLHALQRATGTLAKQATEELRHEVPEAIPHVLEGDPVDDLSRFADDVDLLVVGARGAGPLRRLATGSVTEALSTRCPSALLITRPSSVEPA